MAARCRRLSETNEKRQKKKEKELSTKGHEGPRRATKALRLTATECQGRERIIDFRLFHPPLIRPGVGWRGQARGQRGVSQRVPVGFQRSRPPETLHRTIGTTHPGARASRPHAIPLRAAQFPCDAAPGHPVGGNGMGSAEAESWRRCRSTRFEEMGEAVPRLVRAGRPRSRGGFIP